MPRHPPPPSSPRDGRRVRVSVEISEGWGFSAETTVSRKQKYISVDEPNNDLFLCPSLWGSDMVMVQCCFTQNRLNIKVVCQMKSQH